MEKVKTTFSALNIKPSLAKNIKVQGDIASSSKSIKEKIQEGVSLLVEREKDRKNIFRCWTCNEYSHYTYKCSKRERKYKGRFKSRRPKNCLYANDEEEYDKK